MHRSIPFQVMLKKNLSCCVHQVDYGYSLGVPALMAVAHQGIPLYQPQVPGDAGKQSTQLNHLH